MTDPEVFAHLGLLRISEQEHAELEALKAAYPEVEFTRGPDGSVRATGPGWPHPVRAATAAGLAEALERRGRGQRDPAP